MTVSIDSHIMDSFEIFPYVYLLLFNFPHYPSRSNNRSGRRAGNVSHPYSFPLVSLIHGADEE